MASGADAGRLLAQMYSPAFEGIVAAGGILHVTACYEAPVPAARGDNCYYTLQINEHTPKSDWDFFVLNSARASADVSLVSGQLLRDEPHLLCSIQGRPDVVAALVDWRTRRLTARGSSPVDPSSSSAADAGADADAPSLASLSLSTARPLGTLTTGPDCFVLTRLFDECGPRPHCTLPLAHKIFSEQPSGSVTIITTSAACQLMGVAAGRPATDNVPRAPLFPLTPPAPRPESALSPTSAAADSAAVHFADGNDDGIEASGGARAWRSVFHSHSVAIAGVGCVPSAPAASLLAPVAVFAAVKDAGARTVAVELGPNSTYLCYKRSPFPDAEADADDDGSVDAVGADSGAGDDVGAALVDVLMLSVFRGPLGCADSDVIVRDWAGANCSSWGVSPVPTPASAGDSGTKRDQFHPLPGYALGFTLKQLYRDFDLAARPFNPRYCALPAAQTGGEAVAPPLADIPAAGCPWGTDGAHLTYQGWTFYLLKRRSAPLARSQ
jgi:hypothetical protein